MYSLYTFHAPAMEQHYSNIRIAGTLDIYVILFKLVRGWVLHLKLMYPLE